MRVHYRSFKAFFEYLLINAFVLILAFFVRDNVKFVTWISLVQIIVSFIFIIRLKHEYMLIGTVFLGLSYLFHFGQALIIIFFNNDIYSERNVIAMTSYESFVSAELFAMCCICAIVSGYILTIKNSYFQYYYASQSETSDEIKRIRKLALGIFFITVIPMLYIDIQKIVALKIFGYDATYQVYISGIGKYLNLIGQFCKPVIPVILYSFSDNKKKAKNVFVVSILYFVVMMFSGDRGTNMIYVITIFMVYFTFVKEIRFKTIVLGAIFGYILLTVINAISLFRYIDFSYAGLLESINRRSSDGVIYSTFREFGGSMLSLVYSLDYIPSNTSFNFGLSYPAAIFTISPWLPDSLVDFFSNSFTFTRAFPILKQDSLGGSFLGELYFNFGWFSPLFAMLIGGLIGKLDTKMRTLTNPRTIATVIVLIPFLFLWVRDFVSIMVMKTFWLCIVFLYVSIDKNKRIE